MIGSRTTRQASRSWPDEASSFLRGPGIAIGIAGWVLFVGGFVGFRGSPSPFPRPRKGSQLQVGGAYRLVRHPIYGGLILITLGWSLASSPLALAGTVALTLVLEGKSLLEESMLVQRFPEYERVHAKGPMAVRSACSLRHTARRLGPPPGAELLHVLMLPDFDRADAIGSYWGNPKTRLSASC